MSQFGNLKMRGIKFFLGVIIVLGIVFSLVNCHSSNTEKSVGLSGIEVSQMRIDSATDPLIIDSILFSKKIAAVYEFTPTINAMAFYLADAPEFFKNDDAEVYGVALRDSLLQYVGTSTSNRDNPACSILDTSGRYPIFKSKGLSAALNKYIGSDYYIYGRKGCQHCTIKDIAFIADPCSGFYYLFILSDFDKVKYGNPLLALTDSLPLCYNGDFSIGQRVAHLAKEKVIRDSTEVYKDSISPIVFANWGSRFFSYEDDFKWSLKDQSINGNDPKRCFFPCRAIFSVQDDEDYMLKYVGNFDAFGIPCD
jgi:hypothetical protein